VYKLFTNYQNKSTRKKEKELEEKYEEIYDAAIEQLNTQAVKKVKKEIEN
jgi:hypothetical protein